MQHTMKEREATITTLETTKKEITIYSETLLSQLNEIESRQTTTASIMSSQDEQVEHLDIVLLDNRCNQFVY